jgi:haloacetate dehalogenase
MFAGFESGMAAVDGTRINFVKGGSGPGLLLLHGHPQTHVIWHKVCAELARHFTVVAADLRGHGDSDKPEGLPDHSNYSKAWRTITG